MADDDLQLACEFARILGEDGVAASRSAVESHGRDEGFPRRGRRFEPDLVVYPRTTEDVAAIVTVAAQMQLPVTPWGAGTSVEGNALPTRGGIVLDTTRMDAVLAIHPADLQAVVQPGVLRPGLNERLRDHGLFFPPDPGVPSTIGGMVGNNSSGTKSVKYGATKDYVLGLEVVLADGTVVRTGSRAVKSASGYDLTALFVGSEGTLGIVTEVTLRLAPVPAVVRGALARFTSVEDAATAVSTLLGAGIVPSMAELLDERVVALMNENGFSWDQQPMLMLEFSGSSEATVAEEIELTQSILEETQGAAFEAVPAERHTRHLEARHLIGHAVFRAGGKRNIKTLDVTVPVSHCPALLRAAYAAMAAARVEGFILGTLAMGTYTFFFSATLAMTRNGRELRKRRHRLSPRRSRWTGRRRVSTAWAWAGSSSCR